MLSGWQITAIRQALGAVKSRKNGQQLAVEFNVHTIIEHIDLHIPNAIITNIHSHVCEMLAEKRSEIAVILESSSRADWLEKRKILKHLRRSES